MWENLKQHLTKVVVLWPACVQLVLFVVIGHNSISLVFTVFFLDKTPILNEFCCIRQWVGSGSMDICPR